MTLGGALLLWFGVAFFLLATVSTCASSSGYIRRVADVFLGKRTLFEYITNRCPTPATQNTFKKSWEAKLTIVGVVMGILIATALIAAGLAGIPFLGAGLPVVFAGILLMGTCISISGGQGMIVESETKVLTETQAPTITHTQTPPEKTFVTKEPLKKSKSSPTLFQSVAQQISTSRPRAYSHASFFHAPGTSFEECTDSNVCR